MIKGNIINLIPAALDDRQKIYDWCFFSETSKSHFGAPNYPDMVAPTFEEFYDEYVPYFFDGSQPSKGSGYMIALDEEPIGFISYCSFHLKEHKSELDLWINLEKNCSKGFGTDAIISLGDYIGKTLGISELIMRPSIKNPRAINSYKKAGFIESDKKPDEYLLDEYVSVYGDGDYGPEETVLLIKQL